MIENIAFGGFRQWLPLDLDVEPADQAQRISTQFEDAPSDPDVRDRIAILLATAAVQARAVTPTGSVTLLGWALLDDDGQRLAPLAVVFARLVRTQPATTFPQLVERLVGDEQLYQPVELDQVQTPHGEAHVARVRTYEERDHGQVVHESISIVWLLPDDVALLLQTNPLDDMVLAGRVCDALVELAGTVDLT